MKKRIILACVSLLIALTTVKGQVYYLHSDNPNVKWTISPEQPVEGVKPVEGVVPGTVFTSYVAAGREEDPNFGDNIQRVDRNKYDRSFWYRTEFTLPKDFTKERVWLNMNGVNRSAEVILNGKMLGRLDGFMQRGRFDITTVVNRQGENKLEILVSIPRKPLANQGSPNYLSSGGWDWMPYVPGLNSGITDKIW
jgi:beta-galactosidase/beta-glucuronidase